MPNWCQNDLRVYVDETKSKKLAKFAKKLIKENKDGSGEVLFGAFVPIPKGYDKDDRWYDWCIENWGTKWEGDLYNWELDDNCLFVSFGSAWTPPVEWLKKVAKKYPDFQFKLQYDEPGMEFCGVATAKGNACVDYSNN